jgi:hypothetical protein
MVEEEPFDWPCLRRMKVIRFVRSFGDYNTAKHWISSADAAAWVAEEAGEGSPLLFLMFLCGAVTMEAIKMTMTSLICYQRYSVLMVPQHV